MQVDHFESCLDTTVAVDRSAQRLDTLHVCTQCTHKPAFVSRKALLQHMRIKHGYRDAIVSFIDGTGIYP